MTADEQLKAFIDRILRCREAEDMAKQDTKEVYAELAAAGYEKSVVGQVVTYLRKREKDGDKLDEQSAKFDLYLEAYERPSHAHTRVGTENGYAATKGVDRDARARRRMSESMDDHKSLVDEMADLGMISEEARTENKALADAVARKFGNGPITPSDATPRLDNTVSPDSAGEADAPTSSFPTNSPEMANESPRKAAEAVFERTAQFQAKASDEANETGPYEGRAEVSADASNGVELVSRGVDDRASTATSEVMDATAGETAPISPEQAPEDTAPHGDAGYHSVESVSPTANDANTGSSAANAGGEDVTGAENAQPDNGPGSVSISRAKTIRDYRPHCLKPEACASNFIDKHCYSCDRASREEVDA